MTSHLFYCFVRTQYRSNAMPFIIGLTSFDITLQELSLQKIRHFDSIIKHLLISILPNMVTMWFIELQWSMGISFYNMIYFCQASQSHYAVYLTSGGSRCGCCHQYRAHTDRGILLGEWNQSDEGTEPLLFKELEKNICRLDINAGEE